MRTRLIVAMALVALGFGVGSKLSAQRPGAPRAPRGAPALVDMASIAQNSVRLKQSIDALKAEYQGKAEELKKESEQGNRLTEEARKLPAGSPQRKELEQRVLKLRADFELHGKKINDNTRERETKIVYGMLLELKEELARHAQANGEPLILRLDRTPPEQLNNPQAILAEIQKPIVYQRDSEITPAILEALNRRGPAAPTAGRPPAAGRNPVR